MVNVDKGGDIKAINYSTLAVLSVFLVESTLGLIIGSLAILSDAFHALFDFASMLILSISIRVSSKPPDEEHMYGHEKFEYLGGMIGGIILIALAASIALEAVSRIIAGETSIRVDLSPIGYAALAYTLSIDLTRIFVLGPRVDGRALTVKVAFYHALSDLCSTLIALFGFWLSTYGILYGDLLASLTLSAALVFLSSRLVWSSIMELSDVAPREVVTRVKEHIEKASSGLFAYEGLRVRGAGNKFFVRATLKFPDYMRLEEAHEIVTRIEEDILKTLREADILFHIEPSGIRGMPTREFIRRVASEVEGVIDVHDIDITRHDGKTYVSLHIQTDPKRSLSKAHEIAEMVEKAIHLSMSGIESVFIHMEPSTVELRRGSAMSDQEISEVIQSVIRKCRDKIRVRRVVTYVTNGRRQANIECIFDESIPIEEAHRITLEIEDKIRREISETTVTVHMEPG